MAFPAFAFNKGLWVVRDYWQQPNREQALIRYAETHNVTDLFVQVRARGRVNYKSPFLQPQQKSYLNLKVMVKEAHRAGMRVHAWINAFYIWSGEYKPRNPRHVFISDTLAVFSQNGQVEHGYFISPGNSANLDQIYQIIHDMNNMGLDGIHLDYFRYPRNFLPLSAESRTSFQQKFYIDPQRVEGVRSNEGLTNVFEKKILSTYRKFLKDNLTQALQKIRRVIKKDMQSAMLLSVAVKPQPDLAEIQYLQPWIEWLKQDLCDWVIPMNYYKENDIFLKTMEKLQKSGYANKIWIGLGVYNIPESTIRTRINHVNNSKFAGYVLFSYNYIYKHGLNI